ncbi:MAG: hypothetical protein PHQ90_09570 [Sulfuricurvum sp.]|uniref:hypothetical protein n=1 Tax=Sulfuricurvum sp. TaxID=2025608 RepID=UPI00261F1FBC|nr:hypothetical protein [Sulfuricurvum sp.]MDD2369538.1 hypothetical protein [Sulfuricurvum sp.]MDD5119484.1 hypothetical protein [Sulfuricurvum sp.]
MQSEELILKAQEYLKTLLIEAFHHTDNENAVVVYDTRCLIATILMEGYKGALPHAQLIDFDAYQPEEVRAKLEALNPSDLVILIQSTNFRLDAFRLRVELFKLKLKVIEHPHLSRMSDEEAPYFIDSLEYDKAYYRHVGRTLQSKIDNALMGVLDSGGEQLIYASPFEPAKVNIGDYTGMTNWGGQFPLGEVFTEAQDLRAVHGRVKIYCFGDVTYKINTPEIPITLIIEEGQVVACENSTPAFDLILSNIRRDEGGVVWIRELGFGLNRAFSKTRTVADTGTYERMCGVHISLGAKHGTYGKPGFKRRDGLYHVDVFADTRTFSLGDEVVYKDGAFVV